MSLGQLLLDCPCFLRSNIYVDSIKTDGDAPITIGKHFTFDDEAAFRRKEAAFLRTLPVGAPDALVAAIREIVVQREAMDRVALRRKRTIARLGWVAKVPALLATHGGLRAPLLVPRFAALIEAAARGTLRHNELPKPVTKLGDGIFALGPAFSPELCAALLGDVHSFNNDAAITRASEAAPGDGTDGAFNLRGRPNSMNRHGVLLDEIGMRPFADALLLEIVRPLAAVLLPESGGATLDHHRAFTVSYEAPDDARDSSSAAALRRPRRGDTQLGLHFDNAEVTLNVCLGESGFRGGGLRFYGDKWCPRMREQPIEYQHEIGHAVLHAGGELHAASPLEAGCTGLRTNVILWARSVGFRRSSGCPMCGDTRNLQFRAYDMMMHNCSDSSGSTDSDAAAGGSCVCS